ncbi:MAG: HEPN domain-containing protein [Candidatus Hodarchaeales archaeon]
MEKLANLFMKKAEGDLKSAEILYKAGRYADAAYHAQQSAEKAIKAILLLNNVDVREHIVSQNFVRYIGHLIPPDQDEAFHKVVEAVVNLEQHWIRPRYPYITTRFNWDPEEQYNAINTEKAIETAHFVLKNIKILAEELFAYNFP